MKLAKKILSTLLIFMLVVTTLVPAGTVSVNAATKIKVRTGKKMDFVVGDSATIALNVKKSTVTFKSSSKAVATVSSKGYIKTVAPGKATITIKSKTDKQKVTVSVIVYPAKVKNVTAEESGNTGVKVKWTAQKKVTGYQIYQSEKLNGTYKLIKTVTGASKNNVTITGLTPSKTYYYKVKSFKTVGGKKLFGEISSNTKNNLVNSQKKTHQTSKKYLNSAKTYKLVWSDEFNYTDKNKIYDNWVYELGNGKIYSEEAKDWVGNSGWGNNEVQFYTEGQNIELTGSELVIKPKYVKASEAYTEEELFKVGITSDADQYIFTSTRMKTAGKRQFKYGKIEFRCVLPSAQGTWAAAWMLGTGNNWPHSGEIDILETVSSNGIFQKDLIPQSIHCGMFNGLGKPRGNIHQDARVSGSTTSYHTYGIIWNDTDITFTIDGKETYTYNPLLYTRTPNYEYWPYDDPFYLLLNVALGGVLGGNVNQAQIVSQAGEMKIDYVRVYQ